MRVKLTDEARGWFRTVKGLNIRTVTLISERFPKDDRPDVKVSWRGKTWCMGSGCVVR